MPATPDKNIWVYAELGDGGPAAVVYELLAKARELAAKTGDSVVAALLGNRTGASAEELLAHGARQVLRVESENLADYHPAGYALVLEHLVRKHRPAVFLFGATAQGRDLAPRLQAKLLTGLTADCLDLDLDDNGLLVQIKPSYGDHIMCAITCPEARPQMATVRPRVFSPLARAVEVRGQIIDEPIEVPVDDSYQVLGRAPLAAAEADLSAAEVIVAIGRGAATSGAVAGARRLARALRGALAVTRPLTDDGRFSPGLLIGQSGQTVKPKCLLNFGISGAIQYVAAIREPGLVISVNRDGEAPIFHYSHYGVVADAEETIQALLTEIGRIRPDPV